MLKKLALVSLVCLFAACASAGKPIDKTHMDDIANGVQDKAQIRQWFGEPYTVQTGLAGHPGGCVERWTYEYAKARGFGQVTYSEVLVVDFDPAGKVCDHAYSKTGNP